MISGSTLDLTVVCRISGQRFGLQPFIRHHSTVVVSPRLTAETNGDIPVAASASPSLQST